MSDGDRAAFWNSRYAERDQIWSGEPNQALVLAAESLPPGRALDLGCGEGADAVWLAERGWEVTAVDISATAVTRAKAVADGRGMKEDQITWLVEDLATWEPTGPYQLVSACFFHSPVEFPRATVLQRAAATVAPGGDLLIVGHAEPPPWADTHSHAHHRFLSSAEELADLQLDDQVWTLAISEVRSREATGPGREPATLRDVITLVHRGPSA
jgi:2-polyprenyl-3-methyl-5-hydroxy-6-metoxy-1,4-benzoquinol methylase